MQIDDPADSNNEGLREAYRRRMLEIRSAFEAGATGAETLRLRANAVDHLVCDLWKQALEGDARLAKGVALVAVGGYGRRELFPCSDVDLMFLLDAKLPEAALQAAVRMMNQELWDSGLRVSPVTRKLAECDRFEAENAEISLALLDHRGVTGDAALFERLSTEVLPAFFSRERDAILRRLAEITITRHAKYGGTLFHLEPNIKDCPGGLRDVHVCAWVTKLLRPGGSSGLQESRERKAAFATTGESQEFEEAVAFLQLLRCFLHFRHERDDNTLDWQAQDAAAEVAVGLDRRGVASPDAAYWMRLYFRNARVVERRALQMLEEAPLPVLGRFARLANLKGVLKQKQEPQERGFGIEHGAVVFKPEESAGGRSDAGYDPAHDPQIVLGAFTAMARAGYRLGNQAEQRLSRALPLLSSDLEEGLPLWRHIEAILCGSYAGSALRAMHALGILELLIPEFHGIDALVIRDAYHRYTVDEHTFVLIDTLHHLEALPGPRTPSPEYALAEWTARFGQILRDLQQPGLLYLAALLHDTGKGRTGVDHARESVRMAENVLARLELDGYESTLVLRLIAGHLEMSAALRRDIFDTATVRAFAGKVQTPEALRMLALFTYADIQAVHPDALTPWKAENLWRLYLATSNYLERNIDEERLGGAAGNGTLEHEIVQRIVAALPERQAELEAFLDGLPERYLSSRGPEQVREHFERSTRFEDDAVQLDFHYSPNVSEITLVTPDTTHLFANMAGALAAWGMNIVTAEAFSNRKGVVLDSFRFTDSFRTLEMNASERERFVRSVHDVVSGEVSVEALMQGRRRGRRKPPKMNVEARIDFDDTASAHSTLVQVVAQDTPGLLRVLSLTLAARQCNIEVALVDTEGETAIDVFYVTRHGVKLEMLEESALRNALLEAIAQHEA